MPPLRHGRLEAHPLRILIIADNLAARDPIQGLLRGAGHETMACADLAEAEGRLDACWDLILAEAGRPGTDSGIELLRQGRAPHGADVILMADQPDLNLAIAALRAGASDFLIRPFPDEDLLGAVRRCEQRRQLAREAAPQGDLRPELDRALAELERFRKIQEVFGQFATPAVAQFVMEHPPDFLRFGHHRTVTILFAEARDFTSFLGGTTADEAVMSLNEVLSHVVTAVLREGGIVNKFTVDGLMAVFGAPMDHPDHAQAAARAALSARETIETLAQMRQVWKVKYLSLGFGINTGDVVAGCLGNRERAEYTVIGQPVSIAASLERAAQAGQILVGPDTAAGIQDRFILSVPRLLQLPDMESPVAAAELAGPRGPVDVLPA
ncbi:MAG: adenylate/guanylate cyclase domain-containing protein [Elusimicrobia bacterium]|nr:adenylate/guanylate cyclase domain-containing protein [Elusimicrobiota bacterium]